MSTACQDRVRSRPWLPASGPRSSPKRLYFKNLGFLGPPVQTAMAHSERPVVRDHVPGSAGRRLEPWIVETDPPPLFVTLDGARESSSYMRPMLIEAVDVVRGREWVLT